MNYEALFTAVGAVATFVLLAIPGFFFSRKKLITAQQVDGISSVIVDFLWPIMVIDAMVQVQVSREILSSALRAALFSAMGIAIAVVVALVYLKVIRMGKVPGCILLFALAISNTGLIGMPLIRSLLGTEALFIASIVELTHNLVIFTIGILVIQTGCGKERKADLKSILSPGFLSVIIGLVLFLAGVRLPAFITDATGMISAAVTPMVMFLIGAQLGEIKISEMFRDKRVLGVLVLKLLVIPAFVFAVLYGFGVDTSMVGRVAVLLFAMPSGACCAIFTRQYKGDYQLATKCVMLTTLCSVLVMPLWMVLTA
ncbi:MAG: AEC family transporter [Oscillospiraceae bacterium]|nr:AEC family transporter [Oscillospiraceae bacterium]